jgi:hypothetical protein
MSFYRDLPHLLSYFAQHRSLYKEQGQGKFNELQKKILTSRLSKQAVTKDSYKFFFYLSKNYSRGEYSGID